MKDKNVILHSIHLGKGELGKKRKDALLAMAAEEACYWSSKPSVGRYIILLADKKIRDDKYTESVLMKKLDELFSSVKERVTSGDKPDDIYRDCKGELESILVGVKTE